MSSWCDLHRIYFCKFRMLLCWFYWLFCCFIVGLFSLIPTYCYALCLFCMVMYFDICMLITWGNNSTNIVMFNVGDVYIFWWCSFLSWIFALFFFCFKLVNWGFDDRYFMCRLKRNCFIWCMIFWNKPFSINVL